MVAVSDVRAKFGWSEEEVPDTTISASIDTAGIVMSACLAEEFKNVEEIDAIKEGGIMLVGAFVLRLHISRKMPELAEELGGTDNSSANKMRIFEILLKVADMLEKEGWRLIAPYCKPSAGSGSVIKTTTQSEF